MIFSVPPAGILYRKIETGFFQAQRRSSSVSCPGSTFYSDTFSACWVICVSMVLQTPTWTTWSLTCVCGIVMFLHAYGHWGDLVLSFYSLIQMTFFSLLLLWIWLHRYFGVHTKPSVIVMVTQPCDDHAWLWIACLSKVRALAVTLTLLL